jgi:hypothetical protein
MRLLLASLLIYLVSAHTPSARGTLSASMTVIPRPSPTSFMTATSTRFPTSTVTSSYTSRASYSQRAQRN